jgi:adenylate cyclase
VQDNFDFRYLDNIKVKGKNKPIKIYELLSLKAKTIAEHRSMIDQFHQAIDLYYGQDFTAAKQLFSKLARL